MSCKIFDMGVNLHKDDTSISAIVKYDPFRELEFVKLVEKFKIALIKSRAVPPDEAWFMSPGGRLLGRIVGIKTQREGDQDGR